MIVVDTNILVYAADRDSPFHESARASLEDLRSSAGAWYLTWGIVYEFLRVVTHRGILRSPWNTPSAWSFCRALMASPGCGILVPSARHDAVLDEVLEQVPEIAGNLVHDARIATLMLEHGIRTIRTRDTDFHRFPFLEVEDPTG